MPRRLAIVYADENRRWQDLSHKDLGTDKEAKATPKERKRELGVPGAGVRVEEEGT